jgi:uncharacterized protein with ATP-grasp and redox domains
MNTSLDCIPCFVRQALDSARFASGDPAVHEDALRHALRAAAEMDLSQSPPAIGQQIHRRLRESSGVADPYRDAKDRFNRMALSMLPALRERVESAADPLALAARFAIAGNVIDMGVNVGLTEEEARASFDRALSEPFVGDVEAFRRAIDEARSILYLADNAGEIVFDRLLIERLPLDRVVVAVRGFPVINDATRIDARMAGLDELVEVIDNGSDAPGTILADCSPGFRRRFAEADLILAKGQGNFETLSDEPANLFFLFKAKCPVIAADARVALGTHALLKSKRAAAPGDGDSAVSPPSHSRIGI